MVREKAERSLQSLMASVFHRYALIFLVLLLSVTTLVMALERFRSRQASLDGSLKLAKEIAERSLLSGDWASVFRQLSLSAKINELTDISISSVEGQKLASYDDPKVRGIVNHCRTIQTDSKFLAHGCISVFNLFDASLILLLWVTAASMVWVGKALLIKEREAILAQIKHELLLITNGEAVATNVTDFRPVQNALASAIEKSRLAMQAQALTEVATQVAHDIRSPISAINLALSALPESETDKVELIRFAAKRINTIAEGLLSKGRQASDNFNDDRAEMLVTVDLHQELQTVLDEKLIQKTEKWPTITGDFEKLRIEISAGVFSDLLRVLSNLISNAVEVCSTNNIVKIECFRQSDQIVLSVSDDGPGIPDEIRSQIGRRGFTTKSESGGNGLGLWHAEKTATALGGTLKIDSSSVGTSIVIVFPFPKGGQG